MTAVSSAMRIRYQAKNSLQKNQVQMAAAPGPQLITPVAVAKNWQTRVHNEMECNKQWEANWGFMVKNPHGTDSLDEFRKNTNGKSSMLALNKAKTPECTSGTGPHNHDESLDHFLHLYMLKNGGQSERMLPQQEFKRPVLTSHTIGWGKNLEWQLIPSIVVSRWRSERL
eukprot:gene21730-28752_t